MVDDFDPDRIKLDWNREKNVTNQRKHGISFEDAASVFADPLSLIVKDTAHSVHEIRYNVIGSTINGTILVVSYTERENKLRIISARKANRAEKMDYEENDQF